MVPTCPPPGISQQRPAAKTGSMGITLTGAEFNAAGIAQRLSEAGVWACGRARFLESFDAAAESVV